MTPFPFGPGVVEDELQVVQSFVRCQDLEVIELGCGKAVMARRLVALGSGCRVAALEVDERQHAENLEQSAPGITFVRAGAQAIPFEANRFDLAWMLKSLHHVALPSMDAALDEIGRVLKPEGVLYVSEPVFAGDLNDVIRLFHDEQAVRRAAYSALERAVDGGRWDSMREVTFEVPVAFRDFEDFEQRIIQVTFADHRLNDPMRRQVRLAFERHLGTGG